MNKHKHLDMIQSVIRRMAQNSFMMKGWSLTLVVALFAFIKDNLSCIMIPFIILPTLLFGGLDAYYLMFERRYRKLYNTVRVRKEEDIDYDMKAPDGCKKDKTFYSQSLISKSILPYYGALLLVSIGVILGLMI